LLAAKQAKELVGGSPGHATATACTASRSTPSRSYRFCERRCDSRGCPTAISTTCYERYRKVVPFLVPGHPRE